MAKLFLSSLLPEEGLSLLEILLAIGILGLVLGPLLTCLNQGLAGIDQAGEASLATQLAAASLEELASLQDKVYLEKLPPRAVVPVEGYPLFTMIREVRVEDTFAGEAGRPKLFRVAVEVNWKDKGRPERVRLESYLMGW